MLRREFFSRALFNDEGDWNRRKPAREGSNRAHEGKRPRPMEGAGRSGWDYEQNAGYGRVFGNQSGPSTYVQGGEIKHYYGKGPRNYRRSDERIIDDINERLTEDRFVDATEIEVQVKDGEVILTGSVDSRAAKRRAEDIAEAVAGVVHLENRLKVNG